MSEKNSPSRVTLEDLLHLKRAERPPEAFWAEFDKELRTRQLAAAVEQRRWWFSLPRVFVGFSRYQMPMGAAAVLAVTFLTLREYREPGIELAIPAAAELAADDTSSQIDPNFVLAERDPVSVESRETLAHDATAAEPAATRTVVSREMAPLVPWGPAESSTDIMSPSARSIAANLAAATEAQPEWGNLLGAKVASLTAKIGARSEPLAQVSSPNDMRRERLFAYNAQPVAMVTTGEDRATPGRERLSTRLSDEQLYESVRRMSGSGDRLTLKF